MSGLAVQRTNVALATQVDRDGRSWLVAPVVALVPGVLNGELVLAEEIGRYTASWDDSPVTIGHPHDGHQYISARSLDALEAFATGRLYNVRFEDGRLKGDVWIDLDRLDQFGALGTQVLQQIVEETGCEVSTGYFRDVERSSGAYEGRRYETVARNIRPDHLALLPTAEGACNWSDGCGIPRTNAKEPSMSKPSNDSVSLAQRVINALAEAFGLATDVRGTARTPKYDGVENTSWGDVDKSLSAYIAGYNKNGGGSEEGSTVADLSAACKSWIASKTLLGEATATTTDDLIFFPVVNPSTDKLNLGALRAVLSGRGAQADIPAAALESAQARAQSLLDESGEAENELGANSQEEGEATVSLFLSEESAAALAVSPGDLPPGAIIVEAPGLSVPLLTYEGDNALQFLSGELAYVARSTAVMAVDVTGIGRLITGEAMDILYLTLGGQAIQRWAYDLSEYLEYWTHSEEGEEDGAEVEVLPLRLILAYLPAGEATPTVTPAARRVAFSHIGVTVGREQIVFPLVGEMRTAPVDPMAEAVNTAADITTVTYADLTAMLNMARNAHPAPQAEIPAEPVPADPIPAALEATAPAPVAEVEQTLGEGVLAENGDEATMNDRRQLIEALLANADCQCERAVLEAMTLDDLKVMAADLGVTDEGEDLLMPALDADVTAPVSNIIEVPVTSPAAAVTAPPVVEAPVVASAPESPATAPVAAPAANADEIAELLAAVRQFGGVQGLVAALNGVQANAQAERASLIASLAANHRCAFSPDQLATFSTEQLRLLEESLEPVDFGVRPRPNGRVPAGGSMIVEIPMPAL